MRPHDAMLAAIAKTHLSLETLTSQEAHVLRLVCDAWDTCRRLTPEQRQWVLWVVHAHTDTVSL